MLFNYHDRKGRKKTMEEIKEAINEKFDNAVEKKEETIGERQTRIAPPWIQYVHKLSALFGNDPEIKMDYDNDEYTLKMFVGNEIKADAINKLLPAEKAFGNVTLKIEVVPSNELETAATLFQNAFIGNPAFAYVYPVEGVFSNPLTYVCFNRQIVQYFDDNLGDPHGNITTLCQDIAKEVFEDQPGVFFCTDNNGENIGRPLGEWP